MKAQLTGALAAALLTAACATPYSDAPLATNFPTSRQQTLQAAAHWGVIAEDMAEELASSLPDKAPLYLRPGADETPFERAFVHQLANSLMEEGHPIMTAAGTALVIDVDTQVVAFSPDRPRYRHAGTATAIASGVWALHDVVLNSARGPLFAGMLALGAWDAHYAYRTKFIKGATPQTEIIVHASVSDARRYLARKTSVYYVADADGALYGPAAWGKTFEVTGEP